MLPDDRDAAYLWDMLDAARAVEEFISPVSFGQYLQDRKLRMAVERAVEIIGEAARRVSDGFRSAYPEIPRKRSSASATSWPMNTPRSGMSGCGYWQPRDP